MEFSSSHAETADPVSPDERFAALFLVPIWKFIISKRSSIDIPK
jgi:hypothetical protein